VTLATGAACAEPGLGLPAQRPVSVNDDLGHLGFQYGPAGQPPVVTGMDIVHCKDGVIVELYTIVPEVRQLS
jgi:hypothetical protein